MSVLRKGSRLLELFLSIMDGIAAISVFAIMLLITADVLSRVLLNKPFAGTAEIVSSVIIIVCFLEIPYVAVKGAHVRTTMLYDKVGAKGKLLIDIGAAILGILVYAFIIRASWGGFTNAIAIGEAEIAGSVRITTIPGRFSIIFGSALMILEFINQIMKYGYTLITGKKFEGEGGKAV
ncbi:MAG: TRAP transporter small permease [Clostridiales bacterium]|nr:TRAP transporter small permease [Clostridiales bacterium]